MAIMLNLKSDRRRKNEDMLNDEPINGKTNYRDINSKTIDSWCRAGWEWGKPVTGRYTIFYSCDIILF